MRNNDIGIGWLESAVGDGHGGLGAAERVAAVQQRNQEAWSRWDIQESLATGGVAGCIGDCKTDVANNLMQRVRRSRSAGEAPHLDVTVFEQRKHAVERVELQKER